MKDQYKIPGLWVAFLAFMYATNGPAWLRPVLFGALMAYQLVDLGRSWRAGVVTSGDLSIQRNENTRDFWNFIFLKLLLLAVTGVALAIGIGIMRA